MYSHVLFTTVSHFLFGILNYTTSVIILLLNRHSMRTEELNYNKEEQIKTFVSEDASDAVKQFLQ